MQALCRRVDRTMTKSTILSLIREGLDCRFKPWISNKKVRTVNALLEVLKEADTSAEESGAIYRKIYSENSQGSESVNEKMTVMSNSESTVANLNAWINGMSRKVYGPRNCSTSNNPQMPARHLHQAVKINWDHFLFNLWSRADIQLWFILSTLHS